MKEGENQNENKNEVSRSRFSICAATSDSLAARKVTALPPHVTRGNPLEFAATARDGPALHTPRSRATPPRHHESGGSTHSSSRLGAACPQTLLPASLRACPRSWATTSRRASAACTRSRSRAASSATQRIQQPAAWPAASRLCSVSAAPHYKA